MEKSSEIETKQIANGVHLLKQVVLHELLEKVRTHYGSRAFLVMTRDDIMIAKGDLQGFMLLSPTSELSIEHRFDSVKHLVEWMRDVKE